MSSLGSIGTATVTIAPDTAAYEAALANLPRTAADAQKKITAAMAANRLQARGLDRSDPYSALAAGSLDSQYAKLAAKRGAIDSAVQKRAIRDAEAAEEAARQRQERKDEESQRRMQERSARLSDAAMRRGERQNEAAKRREEALKDLEARRGPGGPGGRGGAGGQQGGGRGQRLIGMGRILDDMQYMGQNGRFFGPIINNVMELNPLLGSAMIAFDLLYMKMSKSKVKTEAEAMKELANNTARTIEQTQKLVDYERKEADKKAQQEGMPETAQKVRESVNKAIVESNQPQVAKDLVESKFPGIESYKSVQDAAQTAKSHIGSPAQRKKVQDDLRNARLDAAQDILAKSATNPKLLGDLTQHIAANAPTFDRDFAARIKHAKKAGDRMLDKQDEEFDQLSGDVFWERMLADYKKGKVGNAFPSQVHMGMGPLEVVKANAGEAALAKPLVRPLGDTKEAIERRMQEAPPGFTEDPFAKRPRTPWQARQRELRRRMDEANAAQAQDDKAGFGPSADNLSKDLKVIAQGRGDDTVKSMLDVAKELKESNKTLKQIRDQGDKVTGARF